MKKDINESFRSLKLTMAAESYPVLEDLKYFRDYNNYINNSLNIEKASLDDKRKYTKDEDIRLTLEILSYYNEIKKYNVFGNIMRVSLLTSLCAFIEMVITTSCNAYDIDKSYRDYKKANKNRDAGTVRVAKDFLISKGISELNNIPNWEYIFDMMLIRNRFVHVDGKANKYIKSISGQYDFVVIKGKIILGNNFIENYIDILEEFSVNIAKLLYSDESYTKKLMDKLGFDSDKLSAVLAADLKIPIFGPYSDGLTLATKLELNKLATTFNKMYDNSN